MRVVAVVVLVLGLVAIDSGLTLAGWPYSFTNVRLAMSGRTPAAGDAATTTQPSPAAPDGPRTHAGAEARQAPSLAGRQADMGPVISSSGVVTITVANNGYFPTVARAAPDQPFRLAMVTNETYSCARALVVPSLGIQQELPPTGTVMIDVPAQRAGSKLFYSCSMGMYSGVIVFDG